MRCFIGIIIPDKVKAEIDTWRQTQWPQGLASKPVPSHNFHITYLFMGKLADEQRLALERDVTQLTRPKFDVSLDTFEYWRKPSIGYLGLSQPAPKLLALQQRIVDIAKRIGIDSMDISRPYVPHVTLARKFQPQSGIPTQRPTIQFEAHAIGLFESVSSCNGVYYPVRTEWPLG